MFAGCYNICHSVSGDWSIQISKIFCMSRKNWLAIILLNLCGLGLFFSWYLPAEHGVWAAPDASIFFFFNRLISEDNQFATLVALSNNRLFDGIALLVMGLLYLYYFLKTDREGRRRMIVMVLTGLALQLIGDGMRFQRASPTLFFDDVIRVCQSTGLKCKDASSSSFPGDHGMMMLIFAVYMWRYFSWRPFVIALALMLVCALPRVMSGAHWFTDIAVGSVSFVCICLSWWLLTSASDRAIAWVNRWMPGKQG